MKSDRLITGKNKVKRGTGLFDKILTLHLFSTTILFLIIIVSYYHIENNNYNNNLIKKSILIHDLLEISCIDPIVSTIAYDRIHPAIETLYKKNQEIVYIEIYDSKANIIASVGKLPARHLGIEEIDQLFKQHAISDRQTNRNKDHNEFITYLSIGDHYIGLIKIGVTRKHLQAQLEKNILYFLGYFIIAIAITSLIFYGFTNKWIVMPIIKVSAIMKNYDRDPLPTLFDNIKAYNKSITKDEIGIMSIAFERMISSKMEQTKEKEKAESALVKSEGNYRQIFNATSDAIFILDDKTGRIFDVNMQTLTMFGYEKQEVLGLTVEEISSGIPPYDQKGADEKMKKALEEGSHIFEWQAKKKNRDIFWTEVNIKFSKIGNEQRMLAVVRDISERKKTQEMMVQSEKMLSVGGLAAGMAHEINNPLAGVMQTADVMSKRLTSIDIPANMRAAEEIGIHMNDIKAFMEKRGILRMIQTINESGTRMAAIVNNMLSFARKSDTRTSSHSLAELLDRTLELAATEFDLKKHYDFKTIEIKKEYDDTLPPVPCERAKIQQVLLNILRNGSQAMQENQTQNPLFIVRTRFEKEQKTISVEIKDNGPGMDEETRKRVFEPFYTTKPVGVGTGLGLSVSYFIITENHGGELSVESAPDSGAKFTIRLPI